MNGRYFWDDGAAIDAVRNDFPPDVVFGLGTTGGTIHVLEYYGLGNAVVAWSGIFSTGWQDRWRELQNYLAWGYPVPVLVDCGALGGPWYTAHWAIAHKVADNRVHLGAMGGIGSSPTIDEFCMPGSAHSSLRASTTAASTLSGDNSRSAPEPAVG